MCDDINTNTIILVFDNLPLKDDETMRRTPAKYKFLHSTPIASSDRCRLSLRLFLPCFLLGNFIGTLSSRISCEIKNYVDALVHGPAPGTVGLNVQRNPLVWALPLQALLLLSCLDLLDPWNDEWFTITTVPQPVSQVVVSTAAENIHPPLYFVLL